jgi:hypothetical protein
VDATLQPTADVDTTGDPGVWNDARELVSLGLRVFHVKPRSKVPQLFDWPNRATLNPDLLSLWARNYPDANLGIATGGGVLALDVDTKAGGFDSLHALQTEHGELPLTACSRTGGGGLHLLFRVDRGLRIPNSQGGNGGIAPGLDVRGDGGQIVAPPSVHESGQRYAWERHPRDGIEFAPEWLVELTTRPRPPNLPPTKPRRCQLAARKPKPTRLKVARPETPKRAEPLAGTRRADPAALAASFIRDFPILGPGRRHHQMHRAARDAVSRGFVDDDIVEGLCLWWTHFRQLGVTLTPSRRHEAEVRATLRSLRQCPQVELHSAWHQRQIEGVRLSPRLLSLLRLSHPENDSSEIPNESPLLSLDNPRQFYGAPCTPPDASEADNPYAGLTDSEAVYVGSLVVQTAYALVNPGPPVRFTDEQLGRAAAIRFGRTLTRRQGDRSKLKFIETLPTRACAVPRPASKVALLAQTDRGTKTRGAAVGTPSSYAILPAMRALFALGVAVDGRPLTLEDSPCVATIPA